MSNISNRSRFVHLAFPSQNLEVTIPTKKTVQRPVSSTFSRDKKRIIISYNQTKKLSSQAHKTAIIIKQYIIFLEKMNPRQSSYIRKPATGASSVPRGRRSMVPRVPLAALGQAALASTRVKKRLKKHTDTVIKSPYTTKPHISSSHQTSPEKSHSARKSPPKQKHAKTKRPGEIR